MTTIDEVKKYCEEMQKKTHSYFQKELDNDAKGSGMFSHGGSVAYRDVLGFINKEPPHDIQEETVKIKVEYEWKPTQIRDLTKEEAEEIIQGDTINVSNAVVIAKEKGL